MVLGLISYAYIILHVSTISFKPAYRGPRLERTKSFDNRSGARANKHRLPARVNYSLRDECDIQCGFRNVHEMIRLRKDLGNYTVR